jgi:L-ascorbate metabolism protein UlaG (beta-lactamase superfamily)
MLIVPRGLGAAVRHARPHASRVIEVVAGETVRLPGVDVSVDAVPARHWIAPGDPRAAPLGFLVRGHAAVYVAGDTGRFPAMGALAGRVDLALLPVWTWGPHLGPGHLGPRSAAEVLRDLGASAAVPVHWGTLYPRRLHRVWSSPLQGPGPRFADHAARLAPAADVRVLRPGEATTLDL